MLVAFGLIFILVNIGMIYYGFSVVLLFAKKKNSLAKQRLSTLYGLALSFCGIFGIVTSIQVILNAIEGTRVTAGAPVLVLAAVSYWIKQTERNEEAKERKS